MTTLVKHLQLIFLPSQHSPQFPDFTVLLTGLEHKHCIPHLRVLGHRVVQVQVSSYNIQLDSQENHQHAGAVHAHNGAGKT